MALKQGVIDGLDHTLTVCSLTKKFEDAKYFTELNYAQGLFIWIFNKAWFKTLPADLQKTFVQTVHDVCADLRKQAKGQEAEEVAKSKAAGVTFFTLPAADMATLQKMGDPVHYSIPRKSTSSIPATPISPRITSRKSRTRWDTRSRFRLIFRTKGEAIDASPFVRLHSPLWPGKDAMTKLISTLRQGAHGFEEWTLFITVLVAMVALFFNVILRYGFPTPGLVRRTDPRGHSLHHLHRLQRRHQEPFHRAHRRPGQLVPKLKYPLAMFSYVVNLVFAVIMVYFGYLLAALQVESDQSTLILQIPTVYLYAILPLMGVMMVIRVLIVMRDDIRSRRAAAQH
jgi:TRAP-type C4-dicarboxylate transport system permease small subunit